MEGLDGRSQPLSQKINGNCDETEINPGILVKDGLLSRLMNIKKMELNWEGFYDEPRDKPGSRPVYIARSDPGIVFATTNITGTGKVM